MVYAIRCKILPRIMGDMMSAHSAPVVAFEADDHPSLARNLERDLGVARAEQVSGLTAAKDWADFQKRRGIIDGIEIAISLCQKARDKLNA